MRTSSRHRRRVPVLAPLLALGVLVSLLGAAPPRLIAYAPAKPFCLVDARIPDEAYAVEQFVRTHNYSPPPGLRGKSFFADTGHRLPTLLRPYLEYDVFPTVAGHGRPPPRVVLSDRVPYASWYSPDHYDTFLLRTERD